MQSFVVPDHFLANLSAPMFFCTLGLMVLPPRVQAASTFLSLRHDVAVYRKGGRGQHEEGQFEAAAPDGVRRDLLYTAIENAVLPT